MANKLLALVLLVAGLAAAFKEIIPGPGLPSLLELGLTSEELYNMTPTYLVPRNGNGAFGDKHCVHDPQDDAKVNDVIACFNYLEKIGGQNCVVKPEAAFVEAGTAIVGGSYVIPSDSGAPVTVSVTCHEVALAVQWLFTNCNNNGRVGGWQLVTKENMLVSVQNICNLNGGPCQ